MPSREQVLYSLPEGSYTVRQIELGQREVAGEQRPLVWEWQRCRSEQRLACPAATEIAALNARAFTALLSWNYFRNARCVIEWAFAMAIVPLDSMEVQLRNFWHPATRELYLQALHGN